MPAFIACGERETMPLTKISTKHQVTIPKEVFEALQLKVGDLFEVVAERDRVSLIPQRVTSQAPALKLSEQEQALLLTARQKIKAINQDMINSTGLTREEADVAAKTGLIDPDQRYWWLEEWQEGEREVERNYKEGKFEVFDNAKDFLKSLKSL